MNSSPCLSGTAPASSGWRLTPGQVAAQARRQTSCRGRTSWTTSWLDGPPFLLYRRDDIHPASGDECANGNTHEEVTPMWSKLFGGGDGLPREKVDAVVHVIDRYLAEEAELRRLQSERQTIHPRDVPPDKRRALIEEVFALLANTSRK